MKNSLFMFFFLTITSFASLPAQDDSFASETTTDKPQSLLLTSLEEEIAYWQPSSEEISVRSLYLPGDINQLKKEIAFAMKDRAFSEELLRDILEDFYQNFDTSIDLSFYPMEEGGLGVLITQNDRTPTQIKNPPPQFDDEVPEAPSSLLLDQPQDKILVPKAKGLVLAGSLEYLAYQSFENVCGVEIVDLCLPGKEETLKQRLMPLFCGKALTKNDILHIKKEIISYYKDHNRPVVTVQVPSQNVTSGILKLVVIEAKLGKVKAVCNKYFTSCQIENYVRTQPGCPINESKLIQDLNFINRNPFRRVDIIYTPGEKTHTTDIELYTQDRRPIRVYSGIQNDGLYINGRDRWFVGFNWGNVFKLDHILSYQYMHDYGGGHFSSHTAQYTALLPWRHVLYLYGGYSEVEPKVNVYPTARNHGDSSQGSARYHMPIWPVGRYLHDFVLGFDFKRTNNTAEFVEQLPNFGQNTNIGQFMMGYEGNCDFNWIKSTFEWNLFYSPGRWLPSQSNSDYSSLQPGAQSNYLYSRATWMNIFRLPGDFSLSLFLKGQVSNRILLPSERLGLGGYNSVRGYDEHSFNGDHGYIASAEIRSCPVHLLYYISRKRIKDDFQVLAFIDAGQGWINGKKLSTDKKEMFIIGVGPGLRYVINPNISIRADWGFKLEDKKFFRRDSLPSFELSASY